MFSGVARCATCGEGFWGTHQVRAGGRYAYRRLLHAPRGCRSGVYSEKTLIERLGSWLSTLRLPDDAKVRIARFLSERTASHEDTAALVRRQSLERELEQLAKQHRWSVISDDAFLEERRRIQRVLNALPAPSTADPSREDVALITDAGAIWAGASDEWRRRFLGTLLDEMRIGPDRSIELSVRPPYRELVYAALGSGTVELRV